MLQVSDEHNNTLFIQLSKDGNYWNVNSAGIFREAYSRRKPVVASVPTIGNKSGTETVEVNRGHTKGATATSGNSSTTSVGKVTQGVGNEQGNTDVSEQKTPQERWQKEVDEMGEEYARKYVDSSIASLEEAIRKARKQEPKAGSTPEKIKEFLLNQRDKIAEMERQLEEFRQMKGVMNADVRHVVRDVQPKAKESEYSIMKRKYVDDAEVMEILNADEPQTVDEVIATMLASGTKIMGKSEDVNGVHYDGYQAHTGYGTEEQKRLTYYIRTRANGGVSFDRFVEMVESRAIEWGVDVTGKDVTTEVLNFFQQLSGSVKDYIHDKRVAQAQEYIAQREAAEEADARRYFFEDTHFTPEEYELWNEYMEAVTRERAEEFDSQELRDIFAEAYELNKQNNGKTNSIYEGVSEGQGVQGGSEGSVQVDEGEQAATEDTNQEGGADEGLQPAGETGNGGVHEASDGTGTVGQAVAQAEQETDVNPTDGQKEAGNYKKGHVRIDGFDITIENPKGSVRSGRDADGKEWSVTMNNTYGYIRGTEGVDGDHIDVFLSDNLDGWNGTVYVVDQVNEDGSFDEHKVMYGFNSADEAAQAYNSNYSEGWQGLGTITVVSGENFKKWVNSSHQKTKPFAEYKTVDKEVEAKKVEKTSGNESKSVSLQKNKQNGEDEVIGRDSADKRTDGTGVRDDVSNGGRASDSERSDIGVLASGLSFEQHGNNEQRPRAEQEAAGNKIIDNAKKNGLYIERAEMELARIEEARENASPFSRKQKRALETASVSSLEEHHHAVIPSAQGAKILEKLDNLANNLEKLSRQRKGFLNDVAEALGARKHGSGSQYATFGTKNGRTVTIRLADHNARVSTFDNHGEEDGISIVVTPKNNEGAENNGQAHVVEFYYDAIKLRRAEGKPLAGMVRRAMGRDFDSHSIYANGIAHAKKNHGVEGEKIDENSIPLRDEDFELAPYIMVAPDEVHPGSMGTDGRESIRFIKKLENGVVLVVEKENRNSPNDMETINMWADMSFEGADARFKKRPLQSTSQPVNVASNEKANTRTVISDTDAAKIRKDAELAIEKDKKISEMRAFRSKSGEVYGFVKDGRIYLDPRIASAETAVHEYGHLWAEALRKANPEAWKRLTDDLLSHEDVVEQVKKLYPELEGDELAEEVFTHFAGRRGAERLRAERNKAIKEEHTVMGKARIAVAFERLREALRRFWEAARDLFAGRNEKLSEYTAEDFADMMMADLMNGWKPGPGEGGRAVRKSMSDTPENEIEEIVKRTKADGTYMKAPNGKRSNLPEKLWAVVRSRSFKKMFGDWEKLQKKKFLKDSNAVSKLTGREFERVEGKTLTDQVEEYFKSIGGKAYSPFIGDVVLDRNGADDSLAHGMGRLKASAYAAVGNVIEKGIVIDADINHKGRGYNTVVIAAPVEIDNARHICMVVVRRNLKGNRYYLHEVILQEKLLDEGSNTVQKQPQHPIAVANILQNIEKAYDKGKKLLAESGDDGKIRYSRAENDDDVLFSEG